MYKILITLFLFSNLAISQTLENGDSVMTQEFINTQIGEVSVYKKTVQGTDPIIFLHGVYYDHNLWEYHTSRITDRTVIAIDMPLHGASKKNIKPEWDMSDCSDMLIEIIDTLGYDRVHAIGHSWGSMTILRAAAASPDRFIAVGFCNMPVEEGSFGKRLRFGFQHLLLSFRGFYSDQVAKAMFSKESIEPNPNLKQYLKKSMANLSNSDIKQTDKAVITNVESGLKYVNALIVPSLALKGENDYVGIPDGIKTSIVPGAHTSPLEQPEKVYEFIQEVIDLK